MRSLQDWMKYLEQQEQTLQDGEVEEKHAEPQQAKVEEPPERAVAETVESAPDGGTPVMEAAAVVQKSPKPAKRRAPKAQRSATHEKAQKSYKPFKETREELLARLLDPTISLEETARILNVCPTTVRRYTNRGLLNHLRTPGNQRRFKLSEVLSFMESTGKGN